MKVTDQDVAHVADLANLELTAPERERMMRDLNSILDYIDLLKELDTENVVPMTQISVGAYSEHMRDDIFEGLRKSLPHDEAMANAPETDGIFFKVPKVIER